MARPSFAALFLALLGACATRGPSSAVSNAPRAPVAAPAPTDAEGGNVASTTSAALDEVPPPREDGRLPALARPRHYRLALDVDPTQERFHGKATIDVELAKPTSHLVLHGRALNITEVVATAGASRIAGVAALRVSHGGVTPEELVLSFASPLPPGSVTIAIDYDAPFDGELSGLYRVKDGERWYAFTQFETTAARRAFPCFDEPGYKVPVDLAVTTPKGMIAVANTPETSRSDADPARRRFDFATTPPLPTYLVAFAVGDFDVREAAKTPTLAIPIRLIATKGKARLGDGALEATVGLVKELGDYFALPYPFAKLDVVAVPDFAAGAMENPGLVTFREEYVLLDAAHSTVSARRDEAVVIAHELSHMWFGDLVTMKWWNDVWLNEGFATWMESKATDAWRPEYAARTDALRTGLGVMSLDGLTSARAIRQPVSSTSEIEEAFDGISYQKGALVLGMIEQWIGPEAMKRGVREYIRAHAWGSAESSDLLGALDAASGRDVSGVAATFLDRAGVPDVTVTSKCEAGKLTLGLAQSAWHPLGVAPKSTDGSPWRIPVCVQPGPGAAPKCTELAGARGSLDVESAACPPWVLPNARQAGYYRASLAEADVRALAKNVTALDVPAKMGFVGDLWAEVRSGALAPGVFFDVLPAFDGETDSHVLQKVHAVLDAASRSLVEDEARPAFRAYVAARFKQAKARLGWQRRPGEPDDAALARTQALLGMGRVGRDPATLREAERVAARWLKDPAGVDPDVASVAVPMASIDAGPARLADLHLALLAAKTPLERNLALAALGSFEDRTTSERAWDLALGDDVRQQDATTIFPDAGARPERVRTFLSWLAKHWAAAKGKTPAGYAAGLVSIAGAACTNADMDAARAFFEPRVNELEGAARPLAESLESAAACTALRARDAEAVTKYFANGATKGAAR